MLHSGTITSQHDREEHYIPAHKLIRLYGLDPSECVIEPRNPILAERSHDLKEFIHLYPRGNGDYVLPHFEQLMEE